MLIIHVAQASFRILSSHSQFTTSLVNLHLLYMPLLLSTFPLIWIRMASLTCLSRLLWHFFTTLKLNSGGCSPPCVAVWCSSMWLSSLPVFVSRQCSRAISITQIPVSRTYRLAMSLFSPKPALSATFLVPGWLHLAHSLSYTTLLRVHGFFSSSSGWAHILQVTLLPSLLL